MRCRSDPSADTPLLWALQEGGIAEAEMFKTFNMGVGMIIVVAPEEVDAVLNAGVGAFRLGDIVKGEGVELV